jgi:hypothetical protein
LACRPVGFRLIAGVLVSEPHLIARFAVVVRTISTLAALALAIAAFCGASPIQVQPNPFGILFLGIAALIWFKWRRFKYGFDRPVMDDIAQSYWGSGSGGPKVPEQDVAAPRRRE